MSLDINKIEEIIKYHIEEQPYKIECSVCGHRLSVEDIDIDKDLDLSITVEPCSICIENAVEESQNE